MQTSRKDNKGRVLRKGEVYRNTTNNYQYTYTDSFGKRQYVYARDLVSLRQKEEEIFRDRLDGIDSMQAKNQSLNNFFDRYMSIRDIDLAPKTCAQYRMQYDAHVRNALGNRKIKDIKYSDILYFYKGLLEVKNLSYGTIEHLQHVLHPAFEMAVRDCIIRNNPTHNVLSQFKRQTGAMRGSRNALKPEEQRAFLNFLDGHPVYDHWKPIYVFFLGTGVRVGEFCGLTWKDIDFENNAITIDHALIYFAGKLNNSQKRMYISTPKTKAGIRKIPMIPEVRNALDDVGQYQHENGLRCEVEIDGYSDFVFLNRFGNVFLQTDLDRALGRIIDSYNDMAIHYAMKNKKTPLILPHFTCHSLRHTFCSRFCEHETNVKVIQAVMGHVDIGTTMNIYAEVSEKRKKESMETLASNMVLF